MSQGHLKGALRQSLGWVILRTQNFPTSAEKAEMVLALSRPRKSSKFKKRAVELEAPGTNLWAL